MNLNCASVMLSNNFIDVYKKIWFFCLLFTSTFHGVKGLIPEASQEGSLNSFKTYKDVTIFHYTVPKEVLRATWQFAAFMDGKNCQSRDVYIHLQLGSYPIISPDNSTFPSTMYTKKNGTIIIKTMTKYETEATVIIPVDSPEPGDWFVGAYMTYFDEKVQQQGLGHKCHYSIGSVAMWTQANEIQSIPIGIEKTMRTLQPSTYYKIFIPSGTWDFRVTVWACKSKFKLSNDTSNNCIKSLILKGRTLPIYNHTDLNKNLKDNDTYVITELSPFEESYYYLLIVSDGIVDFNIKVVITECPVKITESTFMRKWASRLNNNSLQIYSTMYKSLIEDEGNDKHFGNDKCARRFQLIRVKKLQTFSSVYLLQGREYLTPWLMMTKNQLVVVQFDVLPLVDVGGSLDISINLEIDKTDELFLKNQVVLIICVRRGRVPDRINGTIVCEDNNMMINISTSGKHDGNLLIPYPQPDIWHIGMQAKCFHQRDPVECDSSDLLVSLNIQTRQCVFSGLNSCSSNGVCEEIHRGILHYTTCSCFGGYKGWGCTDEKNVSQHNSLFLSSTMLIISNLFFLPAIILAMKRKLYTEGLVYIATMLFSSIYHACDQHSMKYCIAKYEVLQYCDFFTSILAFWVTLVTLAQLPIQFISVFHMFGVLIIAFGVESDRTGLSSILIPLGIGIFIPIGSYFYNCYKKKIFKRPNNLLKLSVGLGLASIGLVLFTSVETEDNYQYVHSLWHMVIALSLIFLLPLVPPRRVSLITTSQRESDVSELLDFKEHSDTPVFIISSSVEQLATTN